MYVCTYMDRLRIALGGLRGIEPQNVPAADQRRKADYANKNGCGYGALGIQTVKGLKGVSSATVVIVNQCMLSI